MLSARRTSRTSFGSGIRIRTRQNPMVSSFFCISITIHPYLFLTVGFEGRRDELNKAYIDFRAEHEGNKAGLEEAQQVIRAYLSSLEGDDDGGEDSFRSIVTRLQGAKDQFTGLVRLLVYLLTPF